jgi:alpha-mannosidase
LRAVKGKGGEKSYIKVSPDNLILEALKKCEDGKGLVLRLYNVLNKRAKGEVSCGLNPEKLSLSIYSKIISRKTSELKGRS